MAKKRPPGWKKKEQKKVSVIGAGAEVYSGEEMQVKLRELYGRMQDNPAAFGAVVDKDGAFVIGGRWDSD